MPDKNRSQAPRKLTKKRLVIASHNAGKIQEINDLLAPLGIAVTGAPEIGLPEPDETEKSFAGNAVLKAVAAAKASGMCALADDSGLEVAALGGAPGIYSARWAGPSKDFYAAMARIEREIANSSDRRARFVCALALAWPDGHCETFEGEVRGSLAFPPRGEKGFGYDPIFIPDGDTRTFGEIDPGEKHAISHRADAFRRLMKACF